MDSNVIDTLTGAGIALLGVFLSQIVVLLKSFFDKQHQQRVLIQSKYEQFDSFPSLPRGNATLQAINAGVIFRP